MSLLVNLADISNLRRIALGVMTLLLIKPRKDSDLYLKSTKNVKELISILKRLTSMIDEYDYIILLDEPWDKILIKLAKEEYMDFDNEKIKNHILEIIKYLEKISTNTPLDEDERDKLYRFLLVLVDIPISEEHKLLKKLRG